MNFLYNVKQLTTQAICRCFAGPADCCKVNTHPCMNSNGCPCKGAIWGQTSQTLYTLCLLVKSIYFLIMRYIAGLGKWVPGSDSSVRRATDVPESRGQVQIEESFQGRCTSYGGRLPLRTPPKPQSRW